MVVEVNVVVNVRLRSAFESEAQITMAPQPDSRDEGLQVVETRVVPISTSSIAPGLSLSLPH